MTRDEFIQNSIALYGSAIGWQSAIARRLNLSSRHIRRIVSGESKVTEGIAKDLLSLLGESAPQVIHAEWILGEGSDGREYLIHARYPRFQCLVIAEEGSDYDLDLDAGVKYSALGYTLAGFFWIDKIPDNISSLMESGCDFIDSTD